MKYLRLIEDLKNTKTGKMKCFGNSMLPILKSGSLCTFEVRENYEVGDICFSKCKGKFIDAHLITKKDKNKGYLISNNHNHDNGWTKTIYGKVVCAEFQNKIIYENRK